MFDLESKICEWKLMIAESSSMTRKNVDELESHLRESVPDLVAKGLHESEAFMIASLRLGNPDKLSQEYCKVNGKYVWKGRIMWMLLGAVMGTALANTFYGISSIVGATTAIVGFSGTSTSLVSIATRVVCWMILFLAIWQSGRRDHMSTINGTISIGWLASLIALLGFGYGLSIVGTNIHAHSVPIEEFGKSAYSTSIGGLAINICVVAISVAIIAAFGRSRVEKTA